MSDKAMARAEFFKYVAGKTVSILGDAAEGLAKPLADAACSVPGMISKPLIPLSEFDGSVKLLASTKPPLYLIGAINNSITAVSALCAEDGFLFSYQPQDDSLYCAICGAQHVISRSDEEIETDLATIPLFVKEGQICMLLKS
jgi:hypothetical protein